MTQGIWFMDVFCSYIQCWFGMNVKVVWNRGPWWTIWPTSKQQVLPEEHRSSPWSWSTYIMLRLQAYSHSRVNSSGQQTLPLSHTQWLPASLVVSLGIPILPVYTWYIIYLFLAVVSLFPIFCYIIVIPGLKHQCQNFQVIYSVKKNCILPLHGSYLKIRYPKIWHVFTAFGG